MDSLLTTLLLTAQLLFPSVEGRSLERKEMSLPSGFEGKAQIVLIAFTSKQQKEVDTWLPTAKELAAANPELRYYELPVISRRYKFMRGIIDGGMRKGIEDSTQRASTISLYLNQKQFRQNLSLPSDETIYVMLLDDQGYVRWQTDGPLTPLGAQNLKSAVEELMRL